MSKELEETYINGLAKLREELKAKRGYAPRIAARLRLDKPAKVYNVAHGKVKDPKILKALIAEAKHAPSESGESLDIMHAYLTGEAA